MKKPDTNGTVFKFDILAASSNALPLARSIFLKSALSSSTFFKASSLLYIFAINCCPLLTQLDHVFLAENSKTLLNSSATASSCAMHITAPVLSPYRVNVLEALYPMRDNTLSSNCFSMGMKFLTLSGSPAKSIYATSINSIILFSLYFSSFRISINLCHSVRLISYPVGLCAGVLSMITTFSCSLHNLENCSSKSAKLKLPSSLNNRYVTRLLPCSSHMVLYGAQCQSEVKTLSPIFV